MSGDVQPYERNHQKDNMKSLAPFIIALLLAAGCVKNGNPVSAPDSGATSGTIQTGAFTDVATGTIGTGGGSMSVSKPGDPINGLTLTVLSNSFSSSQNFKISSAPITRHSLGSSFKPISPLIEISYQGGYSDQPMKIRVPITISPGKFAMGFFYNKTTGEIEGLPVEDLGSDYIVVSTRHFTSSSTLGKNGGIAYQNPQADLVITASDDSTLQSKGTFDSGFSPGVDDWEFVNYGSYIATIGHCAGQSMTALWYYQAKKKTGSPPLYHQFDQFNDPTNSGILWQDNPKGYRFASTIQKDANWDSYVANADYSALRPDYTWKSFALAILATGQPQFVILRQSVPPNAGHAMIIYKVDYLAGKMYVADPNYPGNNDPKTATPSIRTITFQGGKFQPYISGLNAGDPGTTFDQIAFAGRSAYVDMAQIQNRWSDFGNGTIGNDRFPAYTLSLQNTPAVPLVDGYVSSSDTINVMNRSTAAETFLNGTDHLQVLTIFDQNGNQLARAGSSTKGIATVVLNAGANKLGFYMCGAKGTVATYYVDFKWLTINCVKTTITPAILNGTPNQEYTFTANVQGSGTLSLKYVWSFGDGTVDLTQTGTNTAKHTFTTGGTFTVSLKIYDNSSGLLVSSASSAVYILSSFVTEITGTQNVRIVLGAAITTDNSYNKTFTGPVINGNYNFNSQPMIWTGTSFAGNYSYNVPPTAGTDTLTVSGSVAGTVSADGKTVTQITASELITHRNTPENSNVTVVVKNVPYISNQFNGFYQDYYYWVLGAAAQNCITSVTIKRNLYNPLLQIYQVVNAVSFSYDSNSEIELEFFKKQ
jgi:hypothetical protein